MIKSISKNNYYVINTKYTNSLYVRNIILIRYENMIHQ